MEKKKLFLVVSAVAVFLCIVSTAIAVFPLITGKYKNADKAYSESVDECLEYSFNLDDLTESLDEEELRLNLARAGYGTNSSEARNKALGGRNGRSISGVFKIYPICVGDTYSRRICFCILHNDMLVLLRNGKYRLFNEKQACAKSVYVPVCCHSACRRSCVGRVDMEHL